MFGSCGSEGSCPLLPASGGCWPCCLCIACSLPSNPPWDRRLDRIQAPRLASSRNQPAAPAASALPSPAAAIRMHREYSEWPSAQFLVHNNVFLFVAIEHLQPALAAV